MLLLGLFQVLELSIVKTHISIKDDQKKNSQFENEGETPSVKYRSTLWARASALHGVREETETL